MRREGTGGTEGMGETGERERKREEDEEERIHTHDVLPYSSVQCSVCSAQMRTYSVATVFECYI